MAIAKCRITVDLLTKRTYQKLSITLCSSPCSTSSFDFAQASVTRLVPLVRGVQEDTFYAACHPRPCLALQPNKCSVNKIRQQFIDLSTVPLP